MNDHLSLEDSPFHRWEINGSYHLSIARQLLPEIKRRPELAMVLCLPSFEPEWAIRIHGSEKVGFAATLTTATTQIWAAMHEDDVVVEVSRHDVELSIPIANQLRNIWCQMLREARYRASASGGVDGVSYHFQCFSMTQGFLCGRTWSPDPETTTGRFVALTETLREFTLAEPNHRASVGARLEAELSWFQDIPVRPPVREEATVILATTIESLLKHYEQGHFTDAEVAAQIAFAFEQVRYPAFAEVMDIIEMIPEPIRKLIRA